MAKYILVERQNYTGLFVFGFVCFALYLIYQALEPYFWICGIAVCLLLLVYCIKKIRKDCNAYGYVLFTIGIIVSIVLSADIAYEHYYPTTKPQVIKKDNASKPISKKKHSQKNTKSNKKNVSSSSQ